MLISRDPGFSPHQQKKTEPWRGNVGRMPKGIKFQLWRRIQGWQHLTILHGLTFTIRTQLNALYMERYELDLVSTQWTYVLRHHIIHHKYKQYLFVNCILELREKLNHKKEVCCCCWGVPAGFTTGREQRSENEKMNQQTSQGLMEDKLINKAYGSIASDTMDSTMCDTIMLFFLR